MKDECVWIYSTGGTQFLGTILTIPAALFLPKLYYAIEAGTHRTTEFYLTQHEAEQALKVQQWSFETRREVTA